MGVDSFFGILLVMFYCLCAVCRLAFFNVLETKRQQTEGGSNKFYRGLPVTTISLIFPLLYITRFILPGNLFLVVLHLMLAVVGFLFVLDFRVKKLDIKKLLKR